MLGKASPFSHALSRSIDTATLDAATSSVILADSLAHFRTFAVMYALLAIYYKNTFIYLKAKSSNFPKQVPATSHKTTTPQTQSQPLPGLTQDLKQNNKFHKHPAQKACQHIASGSNSDTPR